MKNSIAAKNNSTEQEIMEIVIPSVVLKKVVNPINKKTLTKKTIKIKTYNHKLNRRINNNPASFILQCQYRIIILKIGIKESSNREVN